LLPATDLSELDALKTHPYWRRFTQKDYLPAACAGCAQMAACDGGCRETAHILGGSTDTPDPVMQAS
jgi:radical SAM protein with 4Fe4S-binding SPASM domain